jgi:hypothetical protein
MFKKMIKTLGLTLLAVSIITACSDDDKKTTEPTVYESIFVHWMNDSTEVSFENMPSVDLEGEKAIVLTSFITDDIVPGDSICTEIIKDVAYEARPLYSYRVVGEDGFSANVKGYPNNIWSDMDNGFILFDTRDVKFPDVPEENFDIAGAYNVKATKHIHIFRKFDVFVNDTVNAIFNLDEMPSAVITNHLGEDEDAISLKSFIDSLVVKYPAIVPENVTYNMKSVDNFGPTDNMTWAQFQTGYWLKNTKQTYFTDAGLTGGRYKLKLLEKITVHE